MGKKKVLRSPCRTRGAMHASSWCAQTEEVPLLQVGLRVLKFRVVHCDRIYPKQRPMYRDHEESDKRSLTDPRFLVASASKPH
jgi:hypothetical protein